MPRSVFGSLQGRKCRQLKLCAAARRLPCGEKEPCVTTPPPGRRRRPPPQTHTHTGTAAPAAAQTQQLFTVLSNAYGTIKPSYNWCALAQVECCALVPTAAARQRRRPNQNTHTPQNTKKLGA